MIRDPDDDGPRLVLADWLMEHGEQETGEFIAIQCELARRREDGIDSDESLLALEARQRALYDDQARSCVERLKGLVHHLWLERGFPHRVSMRLTTFEEMLPRVLEVAPVREVRLLQLSDELGDKQWRQVATSPLWERLSGLELVDGVLDRRLPGGERGERGLPVLLADPCRLFGLRGLSLAGSYLHTEELRLLGSRPWQRLVRLDRTTRSGRRRGWSYCSRGRGCNTCAGSGSTWTWGTGVPRLWRDRRSWTGSAPCVCAGSTTAG